MRSHWFPVYAIDDDIVVRKSIALFLDDKGFDVRGFETGLAFLDALKDLEQGCILLDIHMPGISGLELQKALNDRGVRMPIIMLTGHGNVGMAIRAMKAGADDFLEKPIDGPVLIAAIEKSMSRLSDMRNVDQKSNAALTLYNTLSPREREVLKGLSSGLPNKSIAYDLGISPRTVEVHRVNLMRKFHAASLSDVLRVAFSVQ